MSPHHPNLVNKDFVRMTLGFRKSGAGVDLSRITALLAGTHWVTLDVLLVRKLAWMGIPSDTHWAGHRFDVVASRPPWDGSCERWKDITKSVQAQVEEWKHTYCFMR